MRDKLFFPIFDLKEKKLISQHMEKYGEHGIQTLVGSTGTRKLLYFTCTLWVTFMNSTQEDIKIL